MRVDREARRHSAWTCEMVTGLRSGLYAHGGSKLRLVLIMHQPHLRDPFQIVCGVDLRRHNENEA